MRFSTSPWIRAVLICAGFTAMYHAEPTLNFYIGRKIARLEKEDEVIRWLNNPTERVLVIPRKDFDSIRQKSGNISFEEIASEKGLNYSKGTALEVIAVMSRRQVAQ